MKFILYFFLFLLIIFISCGSPASVPERQISDWREVTPIQTERTKSFLKEFFNPDVEKYHENLMQVEFMQPGERLHVVQELTKLFIAETRGTITNERASDPIFRRYFVIVGWGYPPLRPVLRKMLKQYNDDDIVLREFLGLYSRYMEQEDLPIMRKLILSDKENIAGPAALNCAFLWDTEAIPLIEKKIERLQKKYQEEQIENTLGARSMLSLYREFIGKIENRIPNNKYWKAEDKFYIFIMRRRPENRQ